MRIKKTVIVQKAEEVFIDDLCNRCGLTCKPRHDDGTVCSEESYAIHVGVAGGYDSYPGLGDLSTLHFDLCERCLLEITRDFKIPPGRGFAMALDPENMVPSEVVISSEENVPQRPDLAFALEALRKDQERIKREHETAMQSLNELMAPCDNPEK